MNIDFNNLTPEMVAWLDEERRRARQSLAERVIFVGYKDPEPSKEKP